jgi:hypothetical protein
MAEKKKELYRVRKSWNDSKSQLGAYSILANAKKTCDKAGEGYYVFNSVGEAIHPELKKDEVKLDISEVEASTTEQDFFKPNDFEPTKMKYSAKNPPLVCMQTQSTCYRGTRKMEVKGILWHSTGANNPTLKRYVQPSDDASDKEVMLKIIGVNKYKNDWNHIVREAGLNAWIGKLDNGTVTTVQTMPWNYRPWGCGSGSKGSCNNGWIQFEICEDGLTDPEYFNAVYKEACELTAYLCDMFNIDPHGTVVYNGQNIPTILCHADSYKLKVGSNHGDVLHWFLKHGKNMDTVRDDVAALLPVKKPEVKEEAPVIEPFKKDDLVSIKSGAKYYGGKSVPSWVLNQNWYVVECVNGRVVINKSEDGKSAINSAVYAEDLIMVKAKAEEKVTQYKVCKDWNDEKSQVGSYTVLENAKKAADLAGDGYGVYDEDGALIYKPESLEPDGFKVGDEVRLVPDAKYVSGAKIPNWVIASKLYIRTVRANGDYVIST